MSNETNTAANTNETPRTFEQVPCGRCGGCGEYSYCQTHGTRCFGCGGKGKVYSKRGLLAKRHYETLLSKTAAELQPGDAIRLSNQPKAKFYTIAEIVPDTLNPGRLTIRCQFLNGDSYTSMGCNPDSVFRVSATTEQKERAFAAALAYQESLTKTGKPRKR